MSSEPGLRFQLRLSAAVTPSLTVRVAPFSTSTNNTPILLLPSKKPAVAFLVVSATGFIPTSYSWSWVPNILNSFAVPPGATTSPFGKAGAKTKITLSQEGIYQFKVVAKNATTSAYKNVWVNVWSSRPALNTDGSVGNYPGLTPPKSIRVLHPDPGPFNHPRVLFTALDWTELVAKTTKSSDVAVAITNMKAFLAAGFDSAGATLNTLATTFYEYYVSKYSANVYSTLVNLYRAVVAATGDLILGKNPDTSFYDALSCACYLAWLQYDPSLAPVTAPAALRERFAYLATIVAASANFELAYHGPGPNNNYGLTNSSQKYGLAFCYDVAYNWMSASQQLDTRSYLYSIGYGIFNNSKGVVTGGLTYMPPTVQSGSNQNGGDFPNLADGCILPALAIEGEESTVAATTRAKFAPLVPAVAGAWAGASANSVSNLHRQIRHNSEWNLTRWGFRLNMVACFELGQNIAMHGSLAFARRWEDQFVTTNIYQSCLAVLYNLCRREKDAKLDLFDHHDGPGMLPGNQVTGAVYLAKYMFPDDPAVDYYYQILRNQNRPKNYVLGAAIFASDPFASSMFAVAAAKKMGNTKFDPHRAVCISRNGWLDTDLMLQFENRWDADGHMHTEKNNFSLYALGRAWSNPPGYHVTISDMQASVLVQIPSLIGDLPTSGYIGQSPSSATQTLTNNNFPPVRGKLLGVVEDPAETWTLFSGDAATAYNYANISGVTPSIDTKIPLQSLLYPGLTGALVEDDLKSFTSGNLLVGVAEYNPVLNAKRSVFTVRDAAKVHPYVLVMDDFTKDGTARNYRWCMSNCISFGASYGKFVDVQGYNVYSSLALLGAATSTQAILYHDPIDKATVAGQAGLPRLLVRDVANISNGSQPAMFIDDRPSGYAGGNFTYGVDNNKGTTALARVVSRRFIIERDSVVSPGYKVLLYPFRSSANNTLPTTTWLSDTVLQIVHPNNVTDTITFAAQAAIPATPGKARTAALKGQLTTIIGFSRSNGSQALPVITLPRGLPKVKCSGHNPQGLATHHCNFAITATDAHGKALAYASNGSKGKYIPVGFTRVWVSAIDSKGQQQSVSFVAAVLPSAPIPVLTRVVNLGTPYSAQLTWPFWTGVTGYKVKRSNKSGGPYKTIANLNQYTTSYVDNRMPHPTVYYVVSAVMRSYGLKVNYESPHSTELSTAPASIGKIIGHGVGGVLVRTSSAGVKSFLLSCVVGRVDAAQEQGVFAVASVSGNGTYIIRCSSYVLASAYGSFGLNYRADLTPSAVSVYTGYDAKKAIIFNTRATANAAAVLTSFQSDALTLPISLKLVRNGMFFTSYWSEDGVVWNLARTVRIANMPSNGYVSLAMAGNIPAAGVFDANFL